MRRAAVAAVIAAWLVALPANASSAGELVRQAHAHEAAHEDDVAVRRYMEALAVEATHADAWLGLGALRMKLGDPGEAERVYTSALAHVPSLHPALEGRARARWAMGQHAEAEADLDEYANLERDIPALRELAGWYGVDGRTPAELAVWRRLLAVALSQVDGDGEREARRMVRALIILVDGSDPPSSPVAPDATRRAMAAIARRGGA
ncbi:MAG: tetratricopeptide repeat protein [Myxococcota bacterium]|nr:tetratricopeptide repeat protein [Myxococcota bacterium]